MSSGSAPNWFNERSLGYGGERRERNFGTGAGLDAGAILCIDGGIVKAFQRNSGMVA